MGLPAAAARRRASAATGALWVLGRGVSAARVPLRVAMAAHASLRPPSRADLRGGAVRGDGAAR
ncbi:hypothetical protein ACP4OV_024776 [Aristida adscensionis]